MAKVNEHILNYSQDTQPLLNFFSERQLENLIFNINN